MEKPTKWYRYEGLSLSAFCMQIGLLLEGGVSLDEGLEIMVEDAASKEERELLLYLAQEAAKGYPLCQILENIGTFPPYVVRMVRLGEQSGTLDQIMKSLADYYEKEHRLLMGVKSTLTYPIFMGVMLLVVLFVLFTKVMPTFEKVYEQLGAQLSAGSKTAIELGGFLSGAMLVCGAVFGVCAFVIWLLAKLGHNAVWKAITRFVKKHSKIAKTIACRRFASVVALTLKSGLELEKGLALAQELADHEQVAARIGACRERLTAGEGYYEALKETGLFSGFHVQMIRVGERSGTLDLVMGQVADDFEQEAQDGMDRLIARAEPVMILVLAVPMAFVLWSVMKPLQDVLSAVG